MTSEPYPNGLNCMYLLNYPSVIHSYCPYIDTDDLQQMTPVCIISSVVVGLEPPHLGGTSICSQLNVQVQWCMTVSFGDQSAKAEKS